MGRWLLLIVFNFLVLASIQGQSDASSGEAGRLEVVALADFNFPDLYFENGLEPGFQRLNVGSKSRGAFNPWVPRGSLVLCRREVGPDGTEVYPPVVELEVGPGGQERILFLYSGSDGGFRYRFVDDDYDRFDRLTARFVNLTETDVVCRLETDTVRIAALGEALRRPDVSVEERFRFTFQLLDADQMEVRAPVKTLRFIHPNMRLAFVFAYERRQIQTDTGGTTTLFQPVAVRLYDFVPSS